MVVALAQTGARQKGGTKIDGVNSIIDASISSTQSILSDLEESEKFLETVPLPGSHVGTGRPSWRGQEVVEGDFDHLADVQHLLENQAHHPAADAALGSGDKVGTGHGKRGKDGQAARSRLAGSYGGDRLALRFR